MRVVIIFNFCSIRKNNLPNVIGLLNYFIYLHLTKQNFNLKLIYNLMKTKRNLVIAFAVATLMLPLFSKAQNIARKEAPVVKHEEKVGWQPVKLDDKGSNVQNGVEFYSQKGDCPSGKVTLAKLVNTNNYAVKISYQVSPESPMVNVLVPASATMEGSCSVTDGNLGKLVIKLPETEDAKKKSTQHLLSHLVVAQNQ
jgi:hypothetical protein